MKRLKSIDFLRGIAVILVLFRHHEFIDILNKAGWIGVDLFFVLSGYLVSSLLFKEYQKSKKIDPVHFLARRGFKIYPLFYLAIAITSAIELSFGREYFEYKDLISELLFLQNYFGQLWSHTWSLAVEEHFYFAIALFSFIVAKTKTIEKQSSFVFITLTLMLIPFVCRVINLQYPFSYATHLFPTHLRFDSLLFGVLLSYLHHFSKEQFENFFLKYQKPLFLVALLLISPAFIVDIASDYMNTLGLTQLYLGFGLLLSISVVNKNAYSSIQKITGTRIADLIALVGFYSYGIYLFHMFSIRYGLGILHKLGFEFHYSIEFLMYFFGSIVFGIFISKLVELPILKFRDKVVPRKTSNIKPNS